MIKPNLTYTYDLDKLIFLEAKETIPLDAKQVIYEDKIEKENFENIKESGKLATVSFSNQITYLREETLNSLKDKFGEFEIKNGVTILNNSANKFVTNWYETIMKELNLNVADKNSDEILTLNEFINVKNVVVGYDHKNKEFLISKPKDLMSKEEALYFENQYEVITNIHAFLDVHLNLDMNKDGKITAKELENGTNLPVEEIVKEGVKYSKLEDKAIYIQKKLNGGGSKKSATEKRKEAILAEIKELKKMLAKLDKDVASTPPKNSIDIDKETQSDIEHNSGELLALRKKYGSQNIDKLSQAIENSKRPIEQKVEIKERANIDMGDKDYENLVSITQDSKMASANSKLERDLGTLTDTFTISASDPQTAQNQIRIQIAELSIELVKIEEKEISNLS